MLDLSDRLAMYALMAYDVTRRAREMGIRLALGATRQRVMSLVLRDSLSLLAPALVVGVPGSPRSDRSRRTCTRCNPPITGRSPASRRSWRSSPCWPR